MTWWQYAFMQRALLGGVIVGVITAIIGVYIVLRGMSFMGTGIAHAAFGGVALGLLLGLDPILTAMGFCVLVAWGIGFVTRRGALKEDTAIGVWFAATMAFGILLLGLRQGYNVDLFTYLFGSVLAISPADLKGLLVIGALVLGVVFVLYKELLFVTFDPEAARVAGLPEGFLYYLLLTLVALTVVASIKVVGLVLVSALLVIPAAAAYRWANDFWVMIGLAVAFSVVSVVAGLLFAYALNTASGATIVLTATAIFAASLALAPKRM